MDSSLSDSLTHEKKRLSAEGVVPGQSSHLPAPSPFSSRQSSLVSKKKKVEQLLRTSPAGSGKFRCSNPQGIHLICKNGHNVYKTVPCHARFEIDCPYCAWRWRQAVIENFTSRIKKMKFPVLVTFTLLKGGDHVLTELNGLAHRLRQYLRRIKKKEKEKKKKKQEKKGKKRRRRKKKTAKEKEEEKRLYEIRSSVSCLDPPNHIHFVWDCNYIPQAVLSELWRMITKDSFIVDIRALDQQRWKEAVNYITKYITKISEVGCDADLHGVHVVNSWGKGGYYAKFRMVCKKCGAPFEALWYSGEVGDYENDPVDFVEIDNDHG